MTGSAGTVGFRAARAVTVGALALPMAGGLLLAGATAASAAVLQPGEGTVFTADTTVAIRADHPRGTSSLTLTSPGGSAVTVDSGGSTFQGGTLAYDLDTACWTFPSRSCSGRAPAPNGTWVLEQNGSTTDRVTFVLRIPPQAPAGMTAEAVDTRQVRLSWRRGDEPDLTGYVVTEGGTAIKTVSASTCEGGACSTTVAYDSDGTGEHGYLLRAVRSDGGSGTVESSGSTASATLAAPPPAPGAATADGGAPAGGATAPSGSRSGAAGGTAASPGTSTRTGGSGKGAPASGAPRTRTSGSTTAFPPTGSSGSAVQQAVAQRRAFALSFSTFGPKLGVPKLPPLPQSQSPAVAPLPEGSFEPTLGFEDQVLREKVESQGPAARVRSVVGNALDSEQLVRSTAGALVLLLCGAHLRRWLATSAEE